MKNSERTDMKNIRDGSTEEKRRRIRNSLSREEILQAALDIIMENGVEAMSISSISKKMKCSIASPYVYFKNRDEILNVLLHREEEELVRNMKNALKTSEDVFEQLEAVAQAFWKFTIRNKSLHQILFRVNNGLHRKHFFAPRSYRIFLGTVKKLSRQNRISKKEYYALVRTMWAWMYGVLVLKTTGLLEKTESGFDHVQAGMDIFRKSVQTMLKTA
ncbi:MAG TPA: TetR/AcrR family transcriptional regulator [Leptospiraceae bacterium]|nr:TetR/AcrR family transcriptional regulator [Leptospiraceae bacterium]